MPDLEASVSLGRDALGPYPTVNSRGDLHRYRLTEGNLDVLRVQAINLNRQDTRNTPPVTPLCRAEARRPHDR